MKTVALPRFSRGFTLMELLVAMTLAVAIVALATSLWRTAMATDGRVKSALAERQDVRDALRTVEYYWSHQAGDLAEVRDNVLLFRVRGTVDNRPHAGFACRADSQTGADGGYSLQLIQFRPPKAAVTDEEEQTHVEQSEILLRGLIRCRIGFLQAPAGDKELPTWVTEWKTGRPPDVLRLDLELERGPLPPFIISAKGL